MSEPKFPLHITFDTEGMTPEEIKAGTERVLNLIRSSEVKQVVRIQKPPKPQEPPK